MPVPQREGKEKAGKEIPVITVIPVKQDSPKSLNERLSRNRFWSKKLEPEQDFVRSDPDSY